VFLGSENTGPIHRGVIAWPSEWPHLATEPNSGFAYVVTTRSFIGTPTTPLSNRYHIAVIYFVDGDVTNGALTNSFTQFNFPNPAVFPAFDQLFPAVTTQPDGTVHVTYADAAIAGPLPPAPVVGILFQIFYTGTNPSNLQPSIPVETWVAPQLVSDAPGSMPFFTGVFFSVTASSSTATVNGYVHPAWAASTAFGFVGIVGLDTFTDRGKKPLLPVGGAVLPTNELALLTPYLLVAVFATLGLAYAMRRRFRSINLPTIPTGNW
jgi:hypothetical protein